jgi:hypothetical protein
MFSELNIYELDKITTDLVELEIYKQSTEYVDKIMEEAIKFLSTTHKDIIKLKFIVDLLACHSQYDINVRLECCVCNRCYGCENCMVNFHNHIKHHYTNRNKLLFLYPFGIQVISPLSKIALEWCAKNEYFYLPTINTIRYEVFYYINNNSEGIFKTLYDYLVTPSKPRSGNRCNIDLSSVTMDMHVSDNRFWLISLFGTCLRDDKEPYVQMTICYNYKYINHDYIDTLLLLFGCDHMRSFTALLTDFPQSINTAYKTGEACLSMILGLD